MAASSSSVSGRNQPCPCGSGRKHKHCCGAVASSVREPEAAKPAPRRRGWWTVLKAGLAVALVCAVVVFVEKNRAPARPEVASGASITSELMQMMAPAPWTYDAVNNRHWHAEHGHWHDGPPPASETSAAGAGVVAPISAAMQTGDAPVPAPWYHDVAGNRHWHAEHGHWHDGPPPAESER